MKFKLCAALLLCCSFTSLVAQKTISGTITDVENLPLTGASVVEKGTNNGVTADFDGNYSIDLPDSSAILIFSYVGFATKEVDVGNQTTLNVTLEEDVAKLDEVVLIGYGTQKKKDVTGSVARADVETFKNQANTDIVDVLNNGVPGLNIGVSNQAGSTGSLGIRGTNNLDSGQNGPLIVLDGVIFRGNITDINPNDVASIDVLKDASSAAVYGSQAANGVIVIATKRGKIGDRKPVFSYSVKTSIREDANELKYYDGEGYLGLIRDYDWMQSYTQGPDYNPTYSPISGLNPPEFDGYEAGANVDWPSLITRTGYLQQHDLSVSGATESVNYFVSTGIQNQKDVLRGDDYERITARINLELKLTDWLKFGTNTVATISDFSGIEFDRGTGYTLSPFARPYDSEGVLIRNPNGQINVNPLLVGNDLDSDKRFDLNSVVYAVVDIPWVKGLSYRANFGNSYRTENHDRFLFTANEDQGRGIKDNEIDYDWTFDNILSYNNTFGDHTVAATLVYGREEESDKFTHAQGDFYTNTVLGFNNLEGAEIETINSDASDQSSIYSVVRLNYDYKDRYNITLTGRRDGFSGFGTNNKVAYFPSAAVGWTVSNENFFSGLTDVVSNLKLRASYGTVGNRGVKAYQTLAAVDADDSYVFGEGSGTFIGQELNRLPSPNLKWEKTTGLNLGLDFAFLNGRINGNIEYYSTETTDQLFRVDIPSINGFQGQTVNIGQINNNGFEFLINSRNIQGENFQWNTTLSFSSNKNEVVTILGQDANGDGQEDDLLNAGIFIGEDAGAIYNYNILGLYQIGDELPSATYEPGYFRVDDLNGDGVIDSNDREVIGSELPAYRFAITNTFSYKGLNLSFLINSIQGGKNGYLANNTPWFESNWDDREKGKVQGNRPLIWDYWTPDNPDAEYPSLRFQPEAIPNLRVYKDRSFIRLQDVTLSYNLDKKVIEKLGLQSLGLSLGGKNLAVWTDWKGLDPQLVDDDGNPNGGITSNRPLIRSYTLGLNVSF